MGQTLPLYYLLLNLGLRVILWSHVMGKLNFPSELERENALNVSSMPDNIDLHKTNVDTTSDKNAFDRNYKALETTDQYGLLVSTAALSQVDGDTKINITNVVIHDPDFSEINGESMKNDEELETLCEVEEESPWSCRGLCGQHVNTSCSCVQSCRAQRSCCPDFEYQCPQDFVTPASGEDTFPQGQSSCSDRYRVMLISSCPPGADDADRARCEQVPASSWSVSDLFPVTDSKSGLHFQNIHCWRCNSASGRALPWRANAILNWLTAPPEDYTLSSIMTYVRDNSQLIQWLPNAPFGFSRCFPDLWTVSECPHLAGVEESEKCERTLSYTLVKNKLYKNRFCYECSNESNSQHDVRHCLVPPPINSREVHMQLSVSANGSGKDKIIVKKERGSKYLWMELECWEETDMCQAKSCRWLSAEFHGRCSMLHKPIYFLMKICRIEEFQFPFTCGKPYEAESLSEHVDALFKQKCRAGKHAKRQLAQSNDTDFDDNEDRTNDCLAHGDPSSKDVIQRVSIKTNLDAERDTIGHAKPDMFLSVLKSILDDIFSEFNKESAAPVHIQSVSYDVSKDDGGVFIEFRGAWQSSYTRLSQVTQLQLMKRLSELGFSGPLALCLVVSKNREPEKHRVQRDGTCIPVTLCPRTDRLSDSDVFQFSNQTKAMSGGPGLLLNKSGILETVLLLTMTTSLRRGLVT